METAARLPRRNFPELEGLRSTRRGTFSSQIEGTIAFAVWTEKPESLLPWQETAREASAVRGVPPQVRACRLPAPWLSTRKETSTFPITQIVVSVESMQEPAQLRLWRVMGSLTF